jgi:glyoxylase-like metal-dependent hydrolase (beta-lactamase superfamily II)
LSPKKNPPNNPPSRKRQSRITPESKNSFSESLFWTELSWAVYADGEEISSGLRVIGIDGAAPGEIALHYADNRGTLVVGDALVNFEPYGFSFLLPKHCSDGKQMRDSLPKLLHYKAERILFAHGTPILSNASEWFRGLLNSN